MDFFNSVISQENEISVRVENDDEELALEEANLNLNYSAKNIHSIGSYYPYYFN